MKQHPPCDRLSRRLIHPDPRVAGFTLPEVLLSGVLGALLLTAVAYATFQFTMSISYLEAKAGVTAGESAMLREMMRDVREAWWAEVPSEMHLKLANPDGEYTEYYYEDGDLMLSRPNGDVGVVYSDITSIDFLPTLDERVREGEATENLSDWYAHPVSAAGAIPLEIPTGARLSLGFVAPALESDTPGGSSDEQVIWVSPGTMSLPLAWIPGTEPGEMLRVRLFESWAPGSAEPLGSQLGSALTMEPTLRLAVPDGSSWEVPNPGLVLNLATMGLDLEPGVGYTLVFEATGDAAFVVAAHPQLPSSASDDMAVQDALPGSEFVTMPLGMAFTIRGTWVHTSSVPTEVVTAVTVTLVPVSRPAQVRSASLLSQTLNDDPWYGVIPGQDPP